MRGAEKQRLSPEIGRGNGTSRRGNRPAAHVVGSSECEQHAATRSIGPSSRSRENRSEEHTSELQSLITISYAVFCLKKKKSPDRRPSLARPPMEEKEN